MTPAAAIAAIQAAGYARVGPSTPLVGEIVPIPPTVLAAQAGLQADLYTGGRLGASEYGSGPAAALLAIVEAARNRARAQGKSLTAMLTADSVPSQAGYYGRQTGRWASTAQAPTARTVAAARAALEGGTNVAAGAVKFFDPKVQDGGVQAGRALTKDAVGVVTSWAEEGYQFASHAPAYQLGVDPYQLMLFTKVSGRARTDEALAVIARGRGGGAGVLVFAALGLGLVYLWKRR